MGKATTTSGREYVKTIERLERLRSAYGLRFRVVFTDGTTAKTKAKSQVNFMIENSGNLGVQVYVKAMPNGEIYAVTPLADSIPDA
jgi:hypothetical protein